MTVNDQKSEGWQWDHVLTRDHFINELDMLTNGTVHSILQQQLDTKAHTEITATCLLLNKWSHGLEEESLVSHVFTKLLDVFSITCRHNTSLLPWPLCLLHITCASNVLQRYALRVLYL